MLREEAISTALSSLNPEKLEIVNESGHHAGHSGDDGSAQTHFRLFIVADCFRGLSRVEQHRLVYQALKEEFASGMHALQIETAAPPK